MRSFWITALVAPYLCIDALRAWKKVIDGIPVTDLEVLDGMLLCATPHGLYVGNATTAAGDGYFESYFKDQVVTRILPSCAGGIAHVLANGRLHSSSPDLVSWASTFPSTSPLFDQEIFDVDCNADQLILAAASKTENRSKTQRGDVYLFAGLLNSTEAVMIGSFPATVVAIGPVAKPTLAVYGDIHGPNGASVGVSTDGGASWRHRIPQSAGKRGKLAISQDAVVVTSEIGNVMMSYDGGRSYQFLTYPQNGLPFDSYSSVIATEDLMLIGTDTSGLYVSLNGGASFPLKAAAGNNEFPADKINDISLDPSNMNLFVANDHGVVMKEAIDLPEARLNEELSFFTSLIRSPKAIF